MALNLISDPWIPALRNGEISTIRPDQIAESGVSKLAWHRADFNLACLELLIGLVSMAAPPRDDSDWLARFEAPDPEEVREALSVFAPFFDLAGNGVRFLQDVEAFERSVGPSGVKSVDMLYIDSAGNQTAAKNADLVVKRDRFASLAPAEAAMALYTLQAFAPSGGSGNRTSMRGGGPLVTLVRPLDDSHGSNSLWRFVFANVLPGAPLSAGNAQAALPWLRATRTSEKQQTVIPGEVHPLEAFFGMPRRLRLVFEDDRVVGVVQRPYGTNYVAWQHPLTAYYRTNEDTPEWLPVHPKAGRLSYRNWLGITMDSAGERNGTRRTAATVYECSNRSSAPDFELMVGGWAMDKMTPVDFTLDVYPAFRGLRDEGEERVHRLVEAANAASGALRKALKAACQLDGVNGDAVVETFFAETEQHFTQAVRQIINDTGSDVEEIWYRTLREQAIRIFDLRVINGLADHDIAGIEKRINAKRRLHGALAKGVRKAMNLKAPDKKGQPT